MEWDRLKIRITFLKISFMSAYTTREITRNEAEFMILQVRAKKRQTGLAHLSNEEIDKELHEYVYSEEHQDVVGVLYNYKIVND